MTRWIRIGNSFDYNAFFHVGANRNSFPDATHALEHGVFGGRCGKIKKRTDCGIRSRLADGEFLATRTAKLSARPSVAEATSGQEHCGAQTE